MGCFFSFSPFHSSLFCPGLTARASSGGRIRHVKREMVLDHKLPSPPPPLLLFPPPPFLPMFHPSGRGSEHLGTLNERATDWA